MAEPILMPKLAMAMQDGLVVEWLVAKGEWVTKSQPVMIVETEKVTHECEAPASGYFCPAIELGVTVPVTTTVAWLAATQEELAQLKAGRLPADAPIGTEVEAAIETPGGQRPVRTISGKGRRAKISPVARSLAEQHNLDVQTIAGTGPGGRIVKADVERALEAKRPATGRAPPTPQIAVSPPPPPTEVAAGKRVKATIPLAGMRRAIAEHMMRSLAVSAQMSVMSEVDMAAMVSLRDTWLQREGEIGTRVTYTDLLVKALAAAVRQVPLANSSVIDDEIKIWEDINVGVAVALELGPYESGLIVPVLRNADQMTLIEVSKALRELTGRARHGELTPDDVTGGTITLSNVGQMAAGWSVSTPILNQPQSVLVQTGGISDKPVVRAGQIVVRPIMTLSITFDHRVMDGLPMARFAASIKDLIEDPGFLAP
jgi:pyruvate dehydrogenase E2 component (dihydrolipoamide acetyltransferase)